MLTAWAGAAWRPLRGGRAVGSKAPGSARNHANADAERFGFEQHANFVIFGGDFALARVHYAHVSVGGAAKFRRFDAQGGPIEHHARGFLRGMVLVAQG